LCSVDFRALLSYDIGVSLISKAQAKAAGGFTDVRRGLKYAVSEPINRATGEKPLPRFGRIYFPDLARRPVDPKAPRGPQHRNARALKTDPLYLYIEVNHLL